MAKRITEELRRAVMREMGSRGGANSRKGVTPERAVEMAKRAVHARWARWRAARGKPPKPGDEEYLTNKPSAK